MGFSEIKYLADKVHIHRWPQDSPVWDESVKKQINDSINKNPEQKQITIQEKSIQIQDVTFTNLDKIGVSIPFFKDECTVILEANLGELCAHVHITKKSGNFLELFNQLTSWKNSILQS